MYKHVLAPESQARECNKWELFLPGRSYLHLCGTDGLCMCGGECFGWACWWSVSVAGAAGPMPVPVLALPPDLGHLAPMARRSCARTDHGLPCSSSCGMAGSGSASGWVRRRRGTQASAGTRSR